MRTDEEIQVSVSEVVDHLRINGEFTPALQEVVRRKIAAKAAKAIGIDVTDEELQKASNEFRVTNGLRKAGDTLKWLEDNGISLETFETYLQTNILIQKFKDELEKKADNERYLSYKVTKKIIRDLIYRDWLDEQMK